MAARKRSRKATDSCPTRKKRFRDHEAAVQALRRTSRPDDGRDRKPTRAYPCDRCHGWHLTSWETPGAGR
jgi:hypothetical protein